MIKFEHTEVMGWDHAIRGMRNPLNSWEKTDSQFCGEYFGCIGPNDYDLMKRLRNAGTDHRKFMRMLVVYVDITAPLYWWKEFDTYKVGTVANSCSTMHKIHAKEFAREDFSYEHLMDMATAIDDEFDWNEYPKYGTEFWPPILILDMTIKMLNFYRDKYLETSKKPMKEEAKRAGLMKKYWWQMIQLLPTSYNQKRTVEMNYEVLANIYKSRKNHKLDEWSVGFMEWIESLPYSELITGEFDKEVSNGTNS